MISTDGAALIATVYPVGVLILVFEMRAVLGWLGKHVLASTGPRFVVGLLIGLAVLFATGSSAICVISVSSGISLAGASAAIVAASGLVLYILVCLGIGVAVMLALESGD